MTTLRTSFLSIFLLLLSAQITRAKPDTEIGTEDSNKESQVLPQPTQLSQDFAGTSAHTIPALYLADLRRMLESDEDQIIIWKVEVSHARLFLAKFLNTSDFRFAF